MVEKGAPALLQRHPPHAAADQTELLDPIALERRLSYARARRAAALAGKGPVREGTPPTKESAPAESGIDFRLSGRARICLFIVGLCFGGAAAFVLAPAPGRDRLVAALFPGDGASGLLAALIGSVLPATAPPPGVEVSAPSWPHRPAEASSGLVLRSDLTEPRLAAPVRPLPPAPEFPPAISAALPDDSWPTAGLPAAPLSEPRTVAPAAATAAPLGANPAIAGFPPVASPPAPWTPVELSLSLVTQPAREQAPPVSLLPALAVRVLLHVSPTARGTANETIAALQAAGAADVVAVPVRFELPRTEVRFFHAADRSAAAGVASVLADGAGGALPRTRDFTNFSPQPAAGGVEVWLAAGQ